MRQVASHEPARQFGDQQRLQDYPELNMLALGCRGCPDEPICRGLHTEAGIFSCQELCSCEDPSKCDIVCRNRVLPFFERFQEIGGFDFENVPRVQVLPAVELPQTVPFIGDRHSRISTLNEPVVALPLYRVMHMARGEPHVHSRAELASRFRIPVDATIILTGVDRDYRLEAWWGMADRAKAIAGLRALGISLVTSPNFSLFTNVPRPDNLHSMKRIAICWAELVDGGIPAALHVNARTYHDYTRWAQFIARRPEVTILSFEFGTGAGRGMRLDWHVARLCEVADAVARPLKIIVRGGVRALSRLRAHFAEVVFIETEAFSRTMRRRRATISESGRLRWRSALTASGTPLDDLLADNISAVRLAHTFPLEVHKEASIVERGARRRTSDADNKAGQASFMSQLDAPAKAGAVTPNEQGVIIAPKT